MVIVFFNGDTVLDSRMLHLIIERAGSLNALVTTIIKKTSNTTPTKIVSVEALIKIKNNIAIYNNLQRTQKINKTKVPAMSGNIPNME